MPSTTAGSTGSYAGFGVRFVAALIDTVILFTVGFVMGLVLGKTAQSISWIVGVIYYLYFWVNQNGATPGKKAMGIRVVRVDGQLLTYGTAFLRYIGYIVSGITLGIGYLWIIWDPKKQGFHDKIANTYVVKSS